jgi:hypothetical protein
MPVTDELGLQPANKVPFQQPRGSYRVRAGDCADIKHGLECARELEWSALAPASHEYRLTLSGHEGGP